MVEETKNHIKGTFEMKNAVNKIRNLFKNKKFTLIFASSLAVIVFGIITAFAVMNPPCEHVFDEGTVIVAATCTSNGESEYKCLNCKYKENRDTEMLPHQFEVTTVKEPTCGEEGESSLICKSCRYETSEPIAATGKHDFVETVIKEATCAEEGEKALVCKVCNMKDKAKIEKTTEHKFEETTVKEVTCFEDGEKLLTCSVCSLSKTEAVASSGHSYYSEVTVQAKCGVDGITTYTCSLCGASYTETVPGGEHTFVDATCTSPKTCTNCSYTEGEPLGHDYTGLYCKVCYSTRVDIYKVAATEIISSLPSDGKLMKLFSATYILSGDCKESESHSVFDPPDFNPPLCRKSGTLRLRLEYEYYSKETQVRNGFCYTAVHCDDQMENPENIYYIDGLRLWTHTPSTYGIFLNFRKGELNLDTLKSYIGSDYFM